MDRRAYLRMMCVAGLVLVLVATGGCKRKQKPLATDLGTPASSSQQTEGLPEVPLDQLQWSPSADLQKVYFDYDSFALRADTINILNENAKVMKTKAANVYFQIEGHCDERGTQEYNLALGEKRALAVREYLAKVGVPADRILTISYGEERPEKEGHDESAWKWNRRAQFNEATR